jgi:hypothetical protein
MLTLDEVGKFKSVRAATNLKRTSERSETLRSKFSPCTGESREMFQIKAATCSVDVVLPWRVHTFEPWEIC